jgi:hypothetical protein
MAMAHPGALQSMWVSSSARATTLLRSTLADIYHDDKGGSIFGSGLRATVVATLLLAATAAAQTPADPSRFGQPAGSVERVEKRTATAKHFQLPDGSFGAVISAAPLHYHAPDGSLQDVDLNFHPSGTDQVVDRVDAVRVRVPGGAQQIEVTDAAGNGVRWLTPASPSVAGAQARYLDARGIEWTYAATVAGVKQTAIITARQGPQTYSFGYRLLGAQADFTVDEQGNAVAGGLTVPRVTIVRADGVPEQGGAWQASAGPRLQFDYDDSGLPDQAFPYVIDPTTTFAVAAPANDAVALGLGTYPSGFNSCDTSSAVLAAKTFYQGWTWDQMSLLQWDTSSLSGTVVTSAALTLHVVTAGSVDGRNYVADWYNWGATCDASDYSAALGGTAFSVPVTSLTPGQDNTTALANVGNLSTAGRSYLRAGISGGQPTPTYTFTPADIPTDTPPATPTPTITPTPGFALDTTDRHPDEHADGHAHPDRNAYRYPHGVG